MKHVSFYIAAFVAGSLGVSSLSYARPSTKHAKFAFAHHAAISRGHMRRNTHASKQSQVALVHLNTADAKQLQSLKGIGASKAKQLVAYRSQHGAFTNLDDITKVKGISAGLYQKIITENKGQLTL